MTPRILNKLTATAVARQKTPGMYGDGGGLWLQVSKSGSKSWLYRFMLKGKSREMGLGSAVVVSLAEARQKSAECRKQVADGVDPIQHRVMTADLIRLCLSKSTIYSKIAEGTFPKPIKLWSASRWIEAEIDRWIDDQISRSRGESQ
jgi:predicted DNA-binding transcriptional regulator AlpA